MPLLMCPNDNTSMQTLERAGVQFDMCPSCRGVWLDRGELEKLMESGAQDGRGSAPASPSGPAYSEPRPTRPWGGSDRGDRGDRGYYDEGRRHKKRDSIFDIFD